jgi:hypothetical protein
MTLSLARMLLLCAVPLLLATQAHAKTRRSLTSDEELAALRAAPDNPALVESLRQATAPLMAMSDEELWEFIPPPDLPRALNVRFGFDCPIHGKEIFRLGGHYPWIISPDAPFKVKCPVGGEVYPTNDFEAYFKAGRKEKLDTTQPYLDDGYGWLDAEGNRYWFVGYYVFWQRWRRDVISGVANLARLYLRTGDAAVGHKAGVMLARLAQIYPQMDYSTQAYHNGKWPAAIPGKILDYIWEVGNTATFATAFDDAYDALGEPALVEFCRAKGIENPTEFIRVNLVEEGARAVMDGKLHSNMTHQATLLHLAKVLDNEDPAKGLTTQQMVDWVMWGGGEMGTLLYNGVTRDGAGSENTPGYNGIWWSSFYDLADKLRPLGYDLWADGRLKRMSDYYIDVTVAGDYAPSTGDCNGNIPPQGKIWDEANFRRAFREYGDERFAKVLIRMGVDPKALYPGISDEEAEQLRERAKDLGLRSRDLGGWGMSILDAGSGERAHAVTMYYGSQGGWHGHLDRLNIEYLARGVAFTPEMGYPAHWGHKADLWTRGSPSHNIVMVNGEPQHGKPAGHLNSLAESPTFRLMDASAEVVYPEMVSQYRRAVAMVEAGDGDAYLLDVFRVSGGEQHDYLMHGLGDCAVRTRGIVFGEPRPGTLAGEEIPFGAEDPDNGFQYLSSPRFAELRGGFAVGWGKRGGPALWFHALEGTAQQAIVCDAEPEIREDNYRSIQYLVLRNRGEDLTSAFAGVLEPVHGKRTLRSVSRLQPLEAPEGAVAVRVRLADRTDVLVSNPQPDQQMRLPRGITAAAEFAAFAEDEGGLRAATLVNGSLLATREWSVESSGPVVARILEINHKGNTLVIDRPIARPESMVGQALVAWEGSHSTSYTIKGIAAHPRGALISLGDVAPLEGKGQVVAADEKGRTLKATMRLGGYGIHFAGMPLVGRALLNEAKTAYFPILGLDEDTFTLGGAEPLSAFTDADGDGRTMFWVADLWPEMQVRLPGIVWVEREAEILRAFSTVPATLRLPATGAPSHFEQVVAPGNTCPLSAIRKRDSLLLTLP